MNNLQLCANNVKTGPKQSQKSLNTKIDKTHIDTTRITAIAAKVTSGEITLPGLDLDSDGEWETVWALLDSGSSVHVVNMTKHFPGAHVRKPPPRANGFQTADGKMLVHKGSAVTPVRTSEGLRNEIEWIMQMSKCRSYPPVRSRTRMRASHTERTTARAIITIQAMRHNS